MKKRRRGLPGRPRGSRGKRKTKETALVENLCKRLTNVTHDYLAIYGLEWDDVQIGRVDVKRPGFAQDFLAGVYFVLHVAFPPFIRFHAKNIKLSPYAEGYAKAEHSWREMGMSGKETKELLGNYLPSKSIREARRKLYPSGITKEDIDKVLNPANNVQDLETIARTTGLDLPRVIEIIEAAKKQHRHVDTPLRAGKQILVLDAGKPSAENPRKYGERRTRRPGN